MFTHSHTHGCATHRSDGYETKLVGSQTICLLFRHVPSAEPSTSITGRHTHAAATNFHISCFPPANLWCATFHFCFQQQRACSAPVNRNFVVALPLPETSKQRILLFTCLLLWDKYKTRSLTSDVWCLLSVCLCVRPALSNPAAAAHLHRRLGELAVVRRLQCGQRRDAAEDHRVQRTHRLAHHQGGAAQRGPETGTFFQVVIVITQKWFNIRQICRKIIRKKYSTVRHDETSSDPSAAAARVVTRPKKRSAHNSSSPITHQESLLLD